MERETFQVEFVTPCFLAGAAGQPEWRAASIRGQLRWWFRAVAGGCWNGDLDRVRREEDLLFGSTESKSLLQVQAFAAPASSGLPLGKALSADEIARLWGDESPETRQRLRIRGNGHEFNSNPIQYLGFGPISLGSIRPYFPAESPATFKLRWGPRKRGAETRTVFDKALWAWLNLGGIGAKTRKGFGSLRCMEPNAMYHAPASRKDLEDGVKSLLREVRSFEQEPAWTHFSSRSRILISARAARSWSDAMECLGAWMIGFRRRYGFPGDSRTLGALPLANRDYEWAAPNGRHLREAVPDRAGFGLPLPFRRNVDGRARGETVTWGWEENEHEDQDARRASPLLLHVAKLGSNFYPVLTYLPSAFLPEGARLKFKDHPGKPFGLTDEQRGIIDQFLADLLGKGLIQEVIP
jgi:CRISPR-associated protein Cmr1